MTQSTFTFYKFAIFVTGDTEYQHLHQLFKLIVSFRNCTFNVVYKMPQLRPRKPGSKPLQMINLPSKSKSIPTKDQDIALEVRRYLTKGYHYVLLIDDLEKSGQPQAQAIFSRYRAGLDSVLSATQCSQVSVHFLVNMLEAYYFADAQAIQAVLGIEVQDYSGDVESIPHPKGLLKQLYPGFNEIEDGGEILASLDVDHVLSNPETCASLRTLFAWCMKSIGQRPTAQFQLSSGKLFDVTKNQ